MFSPQFQDVYSSHVHLFLKLHYWWRSTRRVWSGFGLDPLVSEYRSIDTINAAESERVPEASARPTGDEDEAFKDSLLQQKCLLPPSVQAEGLFQTHTHTHITLPSGLIECRISTRLFSLDYSAGVAREKPISRQGNRTAEVIRAVITEAGGRCNQRSDEGSNKPTQTSAQEVTVCVC